MDIFEGGSDKKEGGSDKKGEGTKLKEQKARIVHLEGLYSI